MLLDGKSNEPLYHQIYRHYQEGIERGLYPVGTKLRSIRGIADDLQCSKNTVEAAFRLLVQEGYVASKPGSGYVTIDLASSVNTHQMEEGDYDESNHKGNADAVYDFTYGNLQPNTFPANQWRTITNDLLLSPERELANTYTDPLGEYELRAEIAKRMRAYRGIKCSVEQIIIQGGTQSCIQNFLCLFDSSKDIVAIEDPSFDGIRYTIERSHFTTVPCNVLEPPDVFLDQIKASGAKLVSITPSSQFPTCSVLPEETRRKLLAWAEETDAYIIEDDYCRDFRYKERPLAPLCATDSNGRVIYMGTFSKSLSPALRMNYLILPPKLLARWQESFKGAYSSVPWLSQAVVGRFMKSGQWDKHLRRLQVANLKKYNRLVDSLNRHFGDTIEILENGTGLHLLVNPLNDKSESELIESARKVGVRVYPTSQYWKNEQPKDKRYILIGFSAIEENDIEPGICALAGAWRTGE